MTESRQDNRSTASAFLRHSLQCLQACLGDRSRPEARFVSLATIAGSDGVDGLHPAVRTVVMRQWENAPPLWRFHSDRRAAKASEFAANPRVSAVFWDPKHQLQIRLDGLATECLDTARIAQTWQALGERAQQSFWRCESPGIALEHPKALSFVTRAEQAVSEQTLVVSPDFMLIEVALSSIDCLSLADDPHHRVRGCWLESGWEAVWVAP